MELTRRFIFHGSAAAFGGRIVRPVDVVLESNGASSLPVTGGRSRSQIPETTFKDLVRIGSASTLAEGLFDDVKQQVKVTHGRLGQDELTTTTTVNADVRDVTVGVKPQLTVQRVRAALVSRSPAASGEPAIRVGNDSGVDGVAIDGYKLVVETNTAIFQRFDTHAKLLTAANDPKFVSEHGASLFLTEAIDGRPAAPRTGRLVEHQGVIYGTIVKAIRWDGKPFPGARIDRHVVIVPDFGRIFFGEILISAMSRRLTMMRLQLGSVMGGDAAIGDVQDDGGWYP